MQSKLQVLRCGVTVLTVFAASLCSTQSSADYVGHYRRGGVDSAEQLALMDDNTYCYAVTAGSLDLLSGGRWTVLLGKEGGKVAGKNAGKEAGKVAGKDASVALQEVKPNKPVFPAVAKNAVRIGFDSTHAEPLMQFSLQWKEEDKAPVAERALYD
jgi:hypothetical protein